jgi:hypothetical protein
MNRLHKLTLSCPSPVVNHRQQITKRLLTSIPEPLKMVPKRILMRRYLLPSSVPDMYQSGKCKSSGSTSPNALTAIRTVL